MNVNCHPGTFFVKDGEIVTTGKPTGFLRTEKQYENFVLDFDWMHVEKEKMANSGLFVWGDPLPAVGTPYTRGIEVQVLINFEPEGRLGDEPRRHLQHPRRDVHARPAAPAAASSAACRARTGSRAAASGTTTR